MVDTISQLFLNTVKSYPKDDLVLYKKDGVYVPMSTQQVSDWVRQFALGLRSLGAVAGDKLILLAENSPFWLMTDVSNLCIGGITVPIYTSLMPEQIKYIIDNSDSKIVVCSSPELWEKVSVIKDELTKVNHFITFQAAAPPGVKTATEVQALGKELDAGQPELFEQLTDEVKPSDIASIIYTSGTTGIPKGVMLTHTNFISNVKAVDEVIPFSSEDTALSFLPLSHVLERMVSFVYLYKGISIAYAESIETLGANLVEIKPTIMVAVPRIFEKIYAAVIDNVLTSSSLKRKIFFWATEIGKVYGRMKLQGEAIPGALSFKHKLAHKLVFTKIIAKTGGNVRFFVSGGAALSKNIAEFFYPMGLVVLEGYGLTETSPVISVNTFDHLKFGSVGQLIPGVEVKIAEDGEILTKGPHVMQGYYKMEPETAEALQEGWFYTGDIGYLDEQGYLVITDRKKDIIVTAGGKNVAPQAIENTLKLHPFIDGALVIGDKRKFISALVVPNFEKLNAYAKSKDINFVDNSDLITKAEIVQFFEQEIDKATPDLASYEKVKKVVLLDRDFELEKGEVTPSLKIKRNIVEAKYKDRINALYQE